METALFFLIWAGAIFLMMRFGCGTHITGHRNTNLPGNLRNNGTPNLRWIPPDTDLDPVCGKSVHTAKAKSSVFDGHVYYFCSRDCRERFEAAPQTYLRPMVEAQRVEEQAHG